MRRKKPAASEMQVVLLPEAARLVTLEIHYTGESVDTSRVKGSFVRLKPFPGMLPDDIEMLRSQVRKLGALAVFVQPAGEAMEVGADSRQEASLSVRASAREVILTISRDMCEQAGIALENLSIVEECIAEAGL